MFVPPGRVRRAAILLVPAALVGLGLLARAAAAASFAAFTGYRSPFAFAGAVQHPPPALTGRVVLVLMDGLGMPASRGMPFLNELRARGASMECRVGLPSLSMPARAVLMTGAWQEIHGQTTNYDPRPLTVEHIFQLARAGGRTTALAAGAKTQTLFSPFVARGAVYGDEPETAPFEQYESALARELAAAKALLQQAHPDFAQLELNLADDAGHGWGSASPQYARAASAVDGALRELAALLDLERDTLVVTADHGHVAAGGHGGPEPEVMQVPLVLAGGGVRRGATGTCAQVDVAPTLAVLMGLPLPAANQGTPLLDVLELTPDARRQVLRNAVAQREAFVHAYAGRLATLETDAPAGAVVIAAAPPDAPVAGAASAVAGGEDEGVLSRRLQALVAAEARAKEGRLARDASARWPRAAALALLPALLLAALLLARVFSAREAALAAGFGLGGVAVYHLLLLPLGLGYSLTAVNKDEWLQRFFMKDMALGLATCAAAAGVLCAFQRRRGADLLALCRLAWLCAAVFCTAFVLKVAVVYALHDVFPRWAMPDQFWGMGFYLDTLVLMAVGLAGPALALVAALARLVPVARHAPLPAATG